EALALSSIAAGHRLLELVDDEHIVERPLDLRRSVRRYRPGCRDVDRAARTNERGRHTRSHHRRLPAPRWSDHGGDTVLVEEPEALRNDVLAPEEQLAVVEAVGQETGERARSGCIDDSSRDVERGVVLEDR